MEPDPTIAVCTSRTNPDKYELRNDAWWVVVAVREGARIASLRSVRSGLEFLTQARAAPASVVPSLTTPFQTGPCAGIEECLPTVGACGPETPGGAAPDHGDFWQVPWTVSAAEDHRLAVEAEGFSRPFRFRKEILLNGASLRIAYTLENQGNDALPFLYACHPLFAVDPGDRIELPREISELELYYSRGARLGERGTRITWPRSAEGEALDRAGGPEDGVAEMLYTSRLTEGRPCAIHREATGEMLEIRFSVQDLPYLGLWLCYGGWPDGGDQPLQYAVALEPTTSPCNTLAEAVASGRARWIAPSADTRWEIEFTLAETVGPG